MQGNIVKCKRDRQYSDILRRVYFVKRYTEHHLNSCPV